MPTYAIKAPNGRTYQIAGPAGATQGDVRAEVLRQHPDAGSAPTIMGTVGDALKNLPDDAANLVGNAMSAPVHLVDAAIHPVRTLTALGGMADQAGQVIGGAMQHVRDLSSPGSQGDAPRMDTTAADKVGQDIHDNYMTRDGLLNTVADHPLGAAVAAGAILHPTLGRLGAYDAAGRLAARTGAVAGRVAAPVTDAIGRVVPGVDNILKAGSRGNALAETMRGTADTALSGSISDADAQAAQAAAQSQAALADGSAQAQAARTTAEGQAAKSSRASMLAERYKARSKTLNDRSTAAQAQAAPATLDIGTPDDLSTQGDTARVPALANEANLTQGMQQADAKYRQAMQDVADEQKGNGVGVSDMDSAKALVARSDAVVNPDPVARPAVGVPPTDDAGGKLHSRLLKTLQPREVPLTVKQAKKATQKGIQVNKAPGGGFTRTVKPGLDSVDSFRRYLGKVLSGNVEGYEAINRTEASGMYKDISGVMDEYTKGTSPQVQANWAAGKKALEPYEAVNAGKNIVGVQPGTDVSAVPAANIPGRIVSGGRDTVRQAGLVSGPGPISSIIRSQLQNAFTGKSADAAAALVGPDTKLGDIVHSDSDLNAAVQDYLSRAKAAEQSGAQATDLASRSSSALTRSKQIEAIAQQFSGTAEKTAAQANKYESTATKQASQYDGTAAKATATSLQRQRDLAQLRIAAPQDVGMHFKAMLDRAHAEGSISIDQYTQGQILAQQAETQFAQKQTRDQWMRRAFYTLGIGVPSAALGAAFHASQP